VVGRSRSRLELTVVSVWSQTTYYGPVTHSQTTTVQTTTNLNCDNNNNNNNNLARRRRRRAQDGSDRPPPPPYALVAHSIQSDGRPSWAYPASWIGSVRRTFLHRDIVIVIQWDIHVTPTNQPTDRPINGGRDGHLLRDTGHPLLSRQLASRHPSSFSEAATTFVLESIRYLGPRQQTCDTNDAGKFFNSLGDSIVLSVLSSSSASKSSPLQ
jgi:hypothetical protein